MRALSIYQPAAWLIANRLKTIENRTWQPPKEMIGEPLAIHAARKYDEPFRKHAQALLERMGCDLAIPRQDDDEMSAGSQIVAVATLAEVVSGATVRDPWYSGPFGLRFTDILAIDPLAVKGQQGIWMLDATVADALALRLRDAALPCTLCAEVRGGAGAPLGEVCGACAEKVRKDEQASTNKPLPPPPASAQVKKKGSGRQLGFGGDLFGPDPGTPGPGGSRRR